MDTLHQRQNNPRILCKHWGKSQRKLVTYKLLHYAAIIRAWKNCELFEKLGHIITTDLCLCGQPDTVKHVIYDCPNFDNHRQHLINNLAKDNINWPCQLNKLVQKNTYAYFKEFAEQTIRIREEQYSAPTTQQRPHHQIGNRNSGNRERWRTRNNT